MIAIVLVHPALLPLLLVGGVPVLLTSRRQSQLEFDFLARQTQSMRLADYLTWVQTGRDEAKEVRAFGLARNFGQRLNTLYADYLVILHSTSAPLEARCGAARLGRPPWR